MWIAKSLDKQIFNRIPLNSLPESPPWRELEISTYQPYNPTICINPVNDIFINIHLNNRGTLYSCQYLTAAPALNPNNQSIFNNQTVKNVLQHAAWYIYIFVPQHEIQVPSHHYVCDVHALELSHYYYFLNTVKGK